MLGVKLLKSKTARSILYFITIGGLFSVFTLIILFTWNFIVDSMVNINTINFLEAAGVASILYIFFFSLKFGLVQEKKKKTVNSKKPVEINRKTINRNTENFGITYISSLTNSEKEKLASSLQKCCGKFTEISDEAQGYKITANP